jgi:hypothetical protein
MTRLPEAERTLFFDMLAQLAPPERAVFVARLAAYLEAQRDPGPGDIDRILRAAWAGLWVPPLEAERHGPRHDRVRVGAALGRERPDAR